MWTTRTKVGWGLLLFLAVLMALIGLRYFVYGSAAYFPRQREVYEARTFGLLVHIGAMMLAVVSGPFQFLRSLRERHLAFHRALGRVYIAGALVGALGGVYMAQFSASGTVSDVGFLLLGSGVLIATTYALVRIRTGNVQSHREWMTRSYALIFGAVTLRLYLPFLEAAFGEQVGYAVVAWVSWVPNLVVAEWFVRTRLRRRREPPRGERLLRPAPQAL